MPASLRAAALDLIATGVSVIPCHLKTKRPAADEWKPYQHRRATESEVGEWFGPAGALAVVCGAVSGNAEAIDFDQKGEVFAPWAELVEAEQPGLVARLVCQRSKSGGRHVLYRCAVRVGGNTKLARRPQEGKPPLVLVETRGEGGYVLAAPSPGYKILDGVALTALPVISEEERAILFDCARALNEHADERARPQPKRRDPAHDRPGDEYNARGDVRDVLLRHGWTPCEVRGGNERWRRPGKDHGTSATLQVDAPRLFYVFTSGAPPFEGKHAYSPFSVYAQLEHAGDYHAAARALAQEGYGSDTVAADSVKSVESVMGEQWETPVPIRADLPDLPAFPVDRLPPDLRDYVRAVSDEAQVPVEIVAPFTLAAVSLAICGRFAVRPWDGWTEIVVIWVGAAAPPGARKSKAERRTMGIVYNLEEQLRKEQGPDVARAIARKNVLKKALDTAVKAAAKNPRNQVAMAAAEQAAVEYEEASIPPLPRLVTSNTTPEALAKVLSESDGRLLVASSEGGEVIAIAAGLYSQGKDAFDIFLKGWTADPVSIDRKTTGRVYVPHPCVPVALMFQPVVLLDLGARKSFRGRGLLGRFLFSLSKSNVGQRKAQGVPLPEAVRLRYETMIENLVRLPDRRDDQGRSIPIEIAFSPAAAGKTRAYFDQMETAQRDGGELEGFRDWASKAHGHLVRIAGALHMALHHAGSSPHSIEVAEQTVEDAIALMEFFLPHSRAAFSLMVERPETARAIKILRHLKKREIEVTSKREIHRALPTVFEEAVDLDAPLEILERHGFIRVVQPERRRGPGRSPSQSIVVNPTWRRQIRQIRQKSNSVKNVNSVSGGDPETAPGEKPEDFGTVRF